MKVAIRHRIKGFIQEELASLLDLLDRIVKAVNDNPYVEYEDVDAVTSTSEFVVTLKTLNKTPSYYTIIKKAAAVDVYDSSPESWTRNVAKFDATVDGVKITLRVT